MKIWPMFGPKNRVRAHGTLAPETLEQIKAAMSNQKDLAILNKKIAKLPGDENTVISIYHNSKRTFFTAPGQNMNFLDSYIGTFAAYSSKSAPTRPPVEVKLSNERLPINKDVLNLIV